MPYTGNLLRLSQEPDARKLPGPSPRHGRNEGDPMAPLGQSTVPSGTGALYQGTDFPVYLTPGGTPGGQMPLDNPAPWAGAPPGGPYEVNGITYPRGNPHDSQAVLSQVGSDRQWTGAGGWRERAHDGDPDRGFLRTGFDPAPLYQQCIPRAELDTDGLASPYTDGGPRLAKHLRAAPGGFSSLPESNPPRVGYDGPGFRRGRERVRVSDNPLFASVHRTFGVQVLHPRDAYTPNPAPRMVYSMITPPALPRDPGNPDDTAMARATYPLSPGSVIGGF